MTSFQLLGSPILDTEEEAGVLAEEWNSPGCALGRPLVALVSTACRPATELLHGSANPRWQGIPVGRELEDGVVEPLM